MDLYHIYTSEHIYMFLVNWWDTVTVLRKPERLVIPYTSHCSVQILL